MPLVNRLSLKKDFDRVFKQGKSCFDGIMGLRFLKNGLPHNRYGVIVSLKVSKQATSRNRVKRRLRELLRKNVNQTINGYDLVVIALPPILNKKYQEIEQSLVRHLTKFSQKRSGNSVKQKS